MGMVTISKREYQELVEKKLRYDYLRRFFADNSFAPPPTRSRREIMKAFAGTRQYNRKFLKSLERGLKRSTYFRA